MPFPCATIPACRFDSQPRQPAGVILASRHEILFRDVYKYLHRKYDTETDWYTGAEYPAGAVPAADGSTYYFPEDRVTDALTKRGFNRCLNGYTPTKSKS